MFGVKSTRFGVFYFQVDLLENDQEIIKDVMSKCIVIRAECLLSRRVIEYTALSELFDEVPIGAEIPEYNILFTKGKEGAVTWEFKREN